MSRDRWDLLLVWCVFAGASIRAAEPVTVLPEVTIQGRPVPVSAVREAPVPFASGLFALPGLTLQSQGVAQTDLRIHGAPFSSSGLSIAGIAQRHPQTEHFNLELPLPTALLTSPVLLTGVDQLLGSTAHFAGSVSAEFAPVTERAFMQAGFGERDSHSAGLFAESRIAGSAAWGVSVFGFQEHRGGSDYSDNDLQRWQGGLRLQYAVPGTQVDVVGARQRKHFGARGFYGASPAYPSAEDLDDTLVLASGRWDRAGGAGHVRLSASWRELEDHYVLDRQRPSLYENRHRSRVAAVAADGSEPLVLETLDLVWRLDGEQERLDSSAFGDFRREKLGLALAPVLTVGRVELTAGLRALAFTEDSPALLGLARIVYRLDADNRLFIGISQNTRRPSYTELYYRSVSSTGNPNLDREDSTEIETGWAGRLLRHLTAHATLFQRRTDHTVDWILTGAASRWQAADLGTVENRGIEIAARFEPEAPWTANLAYTWLGKDDDATLYASRYVLDYARHQLEATLRWQVVRGIHLYTTQTLLRQAPNRARAGGRNAMLGRAGIGYVPRRLTQLLFTVEVDNLWGEDFEVHPGQRPCARSLYATATYEF